MINPFERGRRRIEAGYRRAIEAALRLIPLTGLRGPGDILARLRGIPADRGWERWANELARHVVTEVAHHSARTWREAASQARSGRAIHELLRTELQTGLRGVYGEEIRRNADLIRSVPLDVAREFTERVARRATEGVRSAEIARELRDLYPHVSRVKARLIARTETAKTHTAITHARAVDLGVEWYVWETSEDERVRASHRNMAHVVVAWTDAPSPEELIGERSVGRYAPGDVFNCRCLPMPILDLDAVTWPARVYQGGAISRMTRAQFGGRLWVPDLAARAGG